MATWIKLKSGEWGVRVVGSAAVGQSVTATNKAGKSSVVVVAKVVWAGNGVSLCAIESREPAGASRHGSYATIGARTQARMDHTGWTGCSCGSIEGNPRPSDCWSCKHDSD